MISPRRAQRPRGEDRLGAPATWIPVPTERHAEVLDDLLIRYELGANNVPDAHLAALAIEHGAGVCSTDTDTDFARFRDLRRHDPVA